MHLELLKILNDLSMVSPQLWEQFLKEFDVHTRNMLERVVKADPGHALVAHGHAQAVLQLNEEFNSLRKRIAALNKQPAKV